MCKARPQPSSVWVLLAASSGPGQGEVVALSSVPLAAEMVKHLMTVPSSRSSSGRMWVQRTNSRRLGAPRLVVSALQWTEVPPSSSMFPCPRCLGGSDAAVQLGAEQMVVSC